MRLDPDDPQSVVIRFFDDDGIDVDEATQRKIERLYHREDFRRVLAGEIGDIDFPPRTVEHYTAALVSASTSSRCPRRRAQAGARLLLRHGELRHAQPAGQARRRRAGGQPVRQDDRACSPSTARRARPGWPSWCGPRGPTSAR